MGWQRPAEDKKGSKGRSSRRKKDDRAPAAGAGELLPVAGSGDEGSGCYVSSELLFLGVARALGGGDAVPSARALALARALLLLLVVTLFTLLLAAWSPGAAMANGLVFATVLTDPASLLWLGTLHLEFSHLLFLYLVIVLGIIVTQYSDRLGWHLLLCGALAGLGMTQTMHRFLPLIMGLLIFIQLGGTRDRKAGRALVLYLITAAGVLAVQYHAMDGDGPAARYHKAGSTSVVLGAVLPAFDDNAVGAEKLGLSPSCAGHAGVDGHGTDLKERHPCPDVLHMRTGKVLLTLLSNPEVGWRLLDRGLAHARPWVAGALTGGRTAHPSGLSAAMEAIPDGIFMILLVISFIGALVTVGRLLLSIFLGADPMGVFGVALLLSAAAGIEVFISALFSDGFVALDRHTHMMATSLLVCVALVLVTAGGELLHMLKPDPYRR